MNRMIQPVRGMAGRRRGAAAALIAAGLLALAAPAAAQQGVPPEMPKLRPRGGDGKLVVIFGEPRPELYGGWDGPRVQSYQYRIRTAGGAYPPAWTPVAEPTAAPTAGLERYHVIFGLQNGTTYHVQMRAVNARGAGAVRESSGEAPRANSPASYTFRGRAGRIVGTGGVAPVPRVPVLLHLSVLGSISDADGTKLAYTGDDRSDYRWQWIRVRNGVETEIGGEAKDGGATAYRLTPADVGAQVKARVRFRDDRYNLEEWVSDPFPAVGTILPEVVCRPPTLTGGAGTIWTWALRPRALDEPGDPQLRYGEPTGRFFHASRQYAVEWAYRAVRGPEAGRLVIDLEPDLTAADLRQLALHDCDDTYPFRDAVHSGDTYWWSSGADWSDKVRRDIRVSRDARGPRPVRMEIDPGEGDAGAALRITMDERLFGSTPGAGAFTVTVNGSRVEPRPDVRVSDREVTLLLDEAPPGGAVITVTYADPPEARDTAAGPAGVLADTAWNWAGSFTVTLGPPTPPGGGAGPPQFLATPYVFELTAGEAGTPVPLTLGAVVAADPGGGAVAYALTAGDAGRFAVDADSGVVTYLGPGEAPGAGPFQLEVTATDPDGQSATAAVEVRVIVVNAPPVAADDVAETDEDTPVAVDVLANDNDPDGDPLAVTGVSDPANGAVELGPPARSSTPPTPTSTAATASPTPSATAPASPTPPPSR